MSQESKTTPLYRITQFIWYVLYVIETFLFLRFTLKGIGANPNASFTEFIYSSSNIFVRPFSAVLSKAETINGSMIEWNTLLAMLIYWLFTMMIIQLFLIGKPVSDKEAHEKLEAQKSA